jgi:hypothetical protein
MSLMAVSLRFPLEGKLQRLLNTVSFYSYGSGGVNSGIEVLMFVSRTMERGLCKCLVQVNIPTFRSKPGHAHL